MLLNLLRQLFPGVILLAALTGMAAAQPRPYDPKADARADIRASLNESRENRQMTVLLFGANWCPDCVALDKVLRQEDVAAEVGKHFRIVKVDIGDFDRNMDIAQNYGNPTQQGIPAAVVLAADDQPVYITRAGELSHARRMGDDAVRLFFRQLAERVADHQAPLP